MWWRVLDDMIGGERFRLSGMWFFWGWEKPLSFDTDAVTLESVTVPSWRASGIPLPHTSKRTGGNPRTSPDSSVVDVAFLLEDVVWYAVIRSARFVVGFLERTQRLRVIVVFVDPPMSAFFLFLCFWARMCCLAPAVDSMLYHVAAIFI